MSGGRPTKLTPEMAEKVCGLLARGLPLDSVADRCGIAESTLREWRNGEEHEFSAALKAAEAKAEDRWLGVVEEGEQGWQSRAWLLERRFRDRWGRHEKVEHSGAIALPQQLSNAMYAEVAQMRGDDDRED